METKEQFLRNWSVLSKTADAAQVAKWENDIYIFVSGYPVEQRDFAALTTRAIFGSTTPITTDQWAVLNSKVKNTCEGLNVPLPESQEALKVVQALKSYYGVKEGYTNVKILEKVKALESMMRELKEGAI